MPVEILRKYVPGEGLPILKKWFGNYKIHIKITRERSSKLGDYQKTGENQFIITINYNLPPELFFFVFTHEMAHLVAFEKFGQRNIAPHGKEWKHTFRQMLLESLPVYSEKVQPLILQYAASPKANFSVSTALKQHFYPVNLEEGEVFVEQVQNGELFIFKNEAYKVESKRRKNFLCTQISTGLVYVFRPLTMVHLSPRANAVAIENSVKIDDTSEVSLNNLNFGDLFTYNNVRFRLESLRRKNYLCKKEVSEELYIFQPTVKVIKIS